MVKTTKLRFWGQSNVHYNYVSLHTEVATKSDRYMTENTLHFSQMALGTTTDPHITFTSASSLAETKPSTYLQVFKHAEVRIAPICCI